MVTRGPLLSRATPSGTRRAHGFSLIEGVIVLVLMLIVSAILIPALTSTKGEPADLAAQNSIAAAQAAAERVFFATGAFPAPTTVAGLAALSKQEPDVVFKGPTTPSSTPTTVSAARSGTVLGFAASGSGGQCWMERWAYQAATGSRNELYAYGTQAQACVGSAALALHATTPASGTSWASPLHA